MSTCFIQSMNNSTSPNVNYETRNTNTAQAARCAVKPKKVGCSFNPNTDLPPAKCVVRPLCVIFCDYSEPTSTSTCNC
jgi:hypothetical protein